MNVVRGVFLLMAMASLLFVPVAAAEPPPACTETSPDHLPTVNWGACVRLVQTELAWILDKAGVEVE